MVLYFSATGNTEYIAQELARRIGKIDVILMSDVCVHDVSGHVLCKFKVVEVHFAVRRPVHKIETVKV